MFLSDTSLISRRRHLQMQACREGPSTVSLPVRPLLWPGRLDRRRVQMSFLPHSPATARIRQGGPLQRGSHRRWGDSSAWVPHSPGQPASQQEQPLWLPNTLAFPKAGKKHIFAPVATSLVLTCISTILKTIFTELSLSVSLLLLSSYTFGLPGKALRRSP